MVRFAFVTLAFVCLLAGAALWGGGLVWAALGYITVFAYAIDRLTPVLLENTAPDQEFPASVGLSVVLALSHFVVLGIVLGAMVGDALSIVEKVGLFLGAALFAGQIGHPNAHELIHRPNRWLRRLGKAVYVSILMGHHASAHPLVHHVHVGTPRDPVSAPKGRGFWRFFVLAWIGSFRAGWRAERARRSGKAALGHPYFAYFAGSAVVLIVVYSTAGFAGLWIWAALGLYAQLQIFLSDYVQHYGLRRKRLQNGKFEPVGVQHSWNTPHRFSSALMLNAPRHSDHHTHPSRTYPTLHIDQATMPMLPYSLPMMAVFAMVPPLWRRIMDPRVAAWSR